MAISMAFACGDDETEPEVLDVPSVCKRMSSTYATFENEKKCPGTYYGNPVIGAVGDQCEQKLAGCASDLQTFKKHLDCIDGLSACTPATEDQFTDAVHDCLPMFSMDCLDSLSGS
ncbi:MAG TPA: hypothetical protein DFS52_20565 [Myxococcales bacterium]|jgi:hypothetical protein|nr:hypothetical protein [Myxococcales bacterium]